MLDWSSGRDMSRSCYKVIMMERREEKGLSRNRTHHVALEHAACANMSV